MGLFNNTKQESKEIDLTKLRGQIKFEAIKHVNKAGGEYFCIKATFEDGTTLLIDMQLIQLLNLKMHRAIKKSIGKDDSPDLMEELMELVSGNKIRDAILKSIYK
ncbi:MAG: hypothetical protein Q4C11_00265 [Clostridium sp.]|nr:hypothetical protein [Clostridium sp.]